MKLEDFIDLLKRKPYMMEMGAGKLSKAYNISREDVYNAKVSIRKARIRLPRILVFDIETTPLEAFIWQTQVWKARVSDSQVISPWFMLTWSAKWLFSDVTMSMRLTGEEVLEENDKRIVTGLWKVLDEADVVIAHNGDAFDVKNMNSRFIVNSLSPTKPYQTIDTLKIAQRQFGFAHNSLNALAKIFGLDPKLTTDFDLWKRCKKGDEEALRYMEEYNRGDVDLLEQVYLKIRPWIKSHPNVGLYMEFEGETCPNCGGTNLVEDGFYYTQTGKYPALKCECGAYGRRRKSVLDKEKRQNLIISIAR